MSRSVDFELDLGGLRELMNSGEMKSQLLQGAESVASSAGSGYEASVHVPGVVPIATAYPATSEAAQDNYDNNTLLKALGGSGISMTKG